MGRGHHETVTVVIVLIVRCWVGVGCSIVRAVDHKSDMVTTSRFEAIVRVVSMVQVLKSRGSK